MSVKINVLTLGVIAAAIIFGAPHVHAAESKKITINPGDTLEAIATTHGTNYVRLFNANDSLVSPDIINAGDTLRIPDAQEQLPDRYATYAASMTGYTSLAVIATGQNRTVSSISRSTGNTAGNTYAWGNCTWYAKNKRPDLPNMLGNGGSWSGSAASRGLATGSSAQPGAIAEQSGHVAYVESVNNDGSVNISEMNYNGGIGVVNYRSAPASDFRYIY